MNEKQRPDNSGELNPMEQLRVEIGETLREWEGATRYFDYALGQDQVDYAIHAIMTAEKKYEMLLRKAKQIKGPWPEWKGEFK